MQKLEITWSINKMEEISGDLKHEKMIEAAELKETVQWISNQNHNNNMIIAISITEKLNSITEDSCILKLIKTHSMAN